MTFVLVAVSTSGQPEKGTQEFPVGFYNNPYFYNLAFDYIRRHPESVLRKFLDIKDMFFSPFFPSIPAIWGFNPLLTFSRWMMLVMAIFYSMVWIVFKSGRADNAKLALVVSIPIFFLILNYFFNTEYRYLYAFAFAIHIGCFATLSELLPRAKIFIWKKIVCCLAFIKKRKQKDHSKME